MEDADCLQGSSDRRSAGEEIPTELEEVILSSLEKQVTDYDINRPNSKEYPATDAVVHYTRYLMIENILVESDCQEKVFDEMGGDSFKRTFMRWRKKYKTW